MSVMDVVPRLRIKSIIKCILSSAAVSGCGGRKSVCWPRVPLLRLCINVTISSAVAKRPRDALRLSVVSFNSTKRRTQSSTISVILSR